MYYPLQPSDSLLLVNQNDSVLFKFDKLMETLISKHGHDYQDDIPLSDMSLFETTKKLSLKIEIHSISLSGKKDSLKINDLSGKLFVKINH